MGVPKFFRFVSERYPCIMQYIQRFEVPDFDNLYLDMNGIFHVCSHPDDNDPFFRITEEEIFKSIFAYIEFIFNTIKPRKLFFLAVDGVAPRAKMNQQRGRRFRSAQEAESAAKNAEKLHGSFVSDIEKFDSNCITPGTLFMHKLHLQLQYFLSDKISNDPLWRQCSIILSGHDTPGEGEHKVMDYIRYLKSQPDYDPYLRHCFYGLDADLIILSLSTHCPNFSLLREEVKFGSKSKKGRACTPDEIRFLLLHLSIFREYLDMEFQGLKDKLPFGYNLENIIDDWILMVFLIGNDFIPHLPNLHIKHGALLLLYNVYKEVLPTLDGYLQENGNLSLERFQKFISSLSKMDMKNFEYLIGNSGEDEEEETDEAEEEVEKPKSAALQKLINDTESALASEESEADLIDREFKKYKSDYYREKLEFENVDAEVLKSQAECYVRAIQWNLHYYYKGCQSWSWYYPHHYSPYASDLTNFDKVDLNFDMGKPFRPFDQLLAVLPPACKNLLPTAYHSLMTDEKSPIIDFYPTEFETDLNGKTQEWEAIVLLPFINEERLLNAMKEGDDNLSEEERLRNAHGSMLILSYTKENLGLFKSDMFPSFENHCQIEKMDSKVLLENTKNFHLSIHPDYDLNAFIPGFPTFRFVEKTVELKTGVVKLFEMKSNGETVTVHVIDQPMPDLKEIANMYLGKTVYAGWPHLVEARVSSVSNGKERIILSFDGQKSTELSDQLKTHWDNTVHNIRHRYGEKLGIKLGTVAATIGVKKYNGDKIGISDTGEIVIEKLWANVEEEYASQTVLLLTPHKKAEKSRDLKLSDVYPVEAKVIVVTHPNYGFEAQILEAHIKTRSLKLDVTTFEDVEVDYEALGDGTNFYKSANALTRRLGLNAMVFARITGSILMDLGRKKKLNIGLNLKFSKKNQEMPGFTRRNEQTWLYSAKVGDIVVEYLEKFPEVFDAVSQSSTDFTVVDVFGAEGKEKATELEKWLDSLPCKGAPVIQCGSQLLDPNVITNLEATLDKSVETRQCTNVTLNVKFDHVFKPDLSSDSAQPVPTKVTHQLYDRVVCCRMSSVVPFALRGCIVGIHADSTIAEPTYDILWDKSFPGGITLCGSSTNRGYRMRDSFFINVSAELRANGPKQKVNVEKQNLTRPSAFASFRRDSPAPTTAPEQKEAVFSSPNQDFFRKMWAASAQRPDNPQIMPRQPAPVFHPQMPFMIGTNAPRLAGPPPRQPPTILNQAPSIPNQPLVKNPANHQVPIRTNMGTNHCVKLQNYCQKMNLGQPLYRSYGNMVSVSLPSGQVYWSVPGQNQEDCRQNAALQALAGLGLGHVNKEAVSEQLKKVVSQGTPITYVQQQDVAKASSRFAFQHAPGNSNDNWRKNTELAQALSEVVKKCGISTGEMADTKQLAHANQKKPTVFYNSTKQHTPLMAQPIPPPMFNQPRPPMPPQLWRQQTQDRPQVNNQPSTSSTVNRPVSKEASSNTQTQAKKIIAPPFVPLQAIVGSKVTRGMKATATIPEKAVTKPNVTAASEEAKISKQTQPTVSTTQPTPSTSNKNSRSNQKKLRNAAKLNWEN